MATITTADGGLASQVRVHYDKTMLYVAVPELLHGKYTTKYTIPAGEGKTINWRRYRLLAPATTAITEGVTPAGNSITIDSIQVSVNQFGDYVTFSDRVAVQSIDKVLNANAKILGQQAGNTLDILLREVMVSGSQVRYSAAGGTPHVTRTAVTAADIINDLEIKRLRRALKRQNAKTISANGGSYYICLVHPDTMMDILATDMYKNTSYYQKANNGFDGMVTALYGIMFIETTNAKIFVGAGAASIDVYASVCFGQDAIGEVDIEQLGLETIFKALGTAGTDDPLNQRQSQGWKTTYAAAILNEAYIIRLEHATTAG